MTLLPIVERELRVASRKRSTYWVRLGMVIVVLVIFIWMIARPGYRAPARLGTELFNLLTMVGFAYAMMVGVFFTSDCLSSEKREGTLGLLFLTDLRSYDVVAGKVFATSVGAFYALFAMVPIIGLPLLVGGVTGAEFGRMIIVLCVTLLFSLSVGTLVSALSREEWQAMSSSFLVLVLIAGTLPAIWGTFFAKWHNAWLDALLLMPSPGFAYRRAFDRYFGAANGAHLFWSSIAVIGGMTMACFLSACIILPWSWRSGGKQRAVRSDFYSKPSIHGGLLQENPVLWLSLRLRGKLFWFGVFGCCALAFWAYFFSKTFLRGKLNWEFVINVYGAFFLFALFKIFVAIVACRRFHEDRRSGAMELLLATPMPVAKMIDGQSSALWRLCRIPIAVLISMNVLLLALGFLVEDDDEFLAMLATVALGGILTLLTDYVALVRIGMLQGMLRTKFNFAVLLTIGQVMVLPWLLVSVVFLLLASTSGFSEEGFIGLALFYFAVSAVVLQLVSLRARERVMQEFRSIASGACQRTRNSFPSSRVSSQSDPNA